MIKIKENDVLWRNYSYIYKDKDHIPHPQNLCAYFWTAVGGFIKFAYDSASWWMVLVCWLLCMGAFILPIKFGNEIIPIVGELPILIFVLVSMFSFFPLLFLTAAKIVWWLEKFEYPPWVEKLLNMFCLTLGYSFIGLILYCCAYGLITKPFEFISGGAILILSIAGIVGIPMLIWWACQPEPVKRFLLQIWSVLVAAKNRVCPLVQPPESWELKVEEVAKLTENDPQPDH